MTIGKNQSVKKTESVLRGKFVLAQFASKLQTVNAGLLVKPIGAPDRSAAVLEPPVGPAFECPN